MSGRRSLRPRERRLAVIAGTLIACWALLSALVQPLWGRVRALQVRVTAHAEKLDALRRLLARGGAIERAYAALAPYLETADDETVRSALLAQLESLARTTGARLSLKPKPMTREGPAGRFDIELEAEGNQEALLAFLDRLFALPRLMAIERLRIAAAPAAPQTLRASLVVQTLLLRSRD